MYKLCLYRYNPNTCFTSTTDEEGDWIRECDEIQKQTDQQKKYWLSGLALFLILYNIGFIFKYGLDLPIMIMGSGATIFLFSLYYFNKFKTLNNDEINNLINICHGPRDFTQPLPDIDVVYYIESCTGNTNGKVIKLSDFLEQYKDEMKVSDIFIWGIDKCVAFRLPDYIDYGPNIGPFRQKIVNKVYAYIPCYTIADKINLAPVMYHNWNIAVRDICRFIFS